MSSFHWQGFETLNVSGGDVDWDLLWNCSQDYMDDEKEGFAILLVTRYHSDDEFAEIKGWLADRDATVGEGCLPLEDDNLAVDAYLFKDANLALEFRMRWS